MKIVINSNILWTISNFRTELIKELIHSKHKVFCIGDVDSFDIQAKNSLEEIGTEVYPIKINRKGINPYQDFRYYKNLKRILRIIKPDLILNFTIKPNIYGSIVARSLKINHISTINGLGSGIISNIITSYFIRFLYKYALKEVFMTVFQNPYDKQYFLEKNIVNVNKTFLIPGSGIDVDFFQLPLRVPEKRIRFLFVGRIIKDKGVIEYLEVSKMARKNNLNTDFYIGGYVDNDNPSGISMNYINGFVKEGYVKYLGSTSKILDFFREIDVVVLPSYREGLSRLLLEAASSRRLIITSDVPGCKDIVIDGYNGFLCLPKSSQSLYACITKVNNLQPNQIAKMQKNSRELIIRKFSKNIINKMYLDLIYKTDE